jgi:hypothetical protein
MPRRFAAIVVATALQAVALVLAHEVVFLARYGSRFGEALVHAGHGETWSAAVSTSLLLGGALALAGLLRLAYLGWLVRRSGAGRHAHITSATGTLGARRLLRTWLRVGPRIALLSVILLTVQENLERAAMGAAMPGAGILLTPEYAGGLWITIVVGLAVGLVAALFEWRRRALIARLRAIRPPVPRTAAAPAKHAGVLVAQPRESLLGRRSALRAPPRMAAA